MKNRYIPLIFVAVLASFITLLGSGFFSRTAIPPESRASLLDKILARNELRCGYAVWPGLVERDPNTGAFSGAFYEYMEALGKQLELKISWVEEVSFGDIPAALNAGRIDAMCSGAWTNPIRGKFVDFTTPIAYQAIRPFVRANDKRFDNNLDAINEPDIIISTVDGESAETIAVEDFPLARLLATPKGTEAAQMLMNVVTGKADIAFLDAETAGRFMAGNPGQIRAVEAKFPLRVFGVPISIKKGEQPLKEMLDNGTRQLLMTGVIDRILTKYEKHPGTFLRAETPFEK